MRAVQRWVSSAEEAGTRSAREIAQTWRAGGRSLGAGHCARFTRGVAPVRAGLGATSHRRSHDLGAAQSRPLLTPTSNHLRSTSAVPLRVSAPLAPGCPRTSRSGRPLDVHSDVQQTSAPSVTRSAELGVTGGDTATCADLTGRQMDVRRVSQKHSAVHAVSPGVGAHVGQRRSASASSLPAHRPLGPQGKTEAPHSRRDPWPRTRQARFASSFSALAH